MQPLCSNKSANEGSDVLINESTVPDTKQAVPDTEQAVPDTNPHLLRTLTPAESAFSLLFKLCLIYGII